MKKRFFILVLLLLSETFYAQNTNIPTIDWEHTDTNTNFHVDFLKLKDLNALIIKIGYSSYWTKGQNSEFIVFQNDGKVLRFLVYQPSSPERKTKIKRKRVNKKATKQYWAFLQECADNNGFNIDKSKLNISTRKGKEKGTMELMHISDGVHYFLQICQGKNYLTYQSYSPTNFIREKYPGYEERQKLVDLTEGFGKIGRKR